MNHKTDPTTLLTDYADLLEQIGANALIAPGAPILLCGGVARHYPFPGANPPPWQLEGVVRSMQASGHNDLAWIVPPAPQLAGIPEALLRYMRPLGTDLMGYSAVARRYGVREGLPAGNVAPVLLLTLCGDPHGRLIGAGWWLAYWARRLGCAPSMFRLAVADATTLCADPRAVPSVCHTLLAASNPEALDTEAMRLFGFRGLADQHEPLRWQSFYRWQEAERETFVSWLYDTAWGRLFCTYQ